MSSETLLLAVGEIRDDYIHDAETAKKTMNWTRWLAAAACLCLMILAALPLLRGKGQQGTDAPAQEINAFAFCGAYYEYTDVPAVLEKYGLPGTLTEAQLGQRIGFLERDGTTYRPCVEQTDAALYTYAPCPCPGVMILRDGEKLYGVLFCNHLLVSGACVEFLEIYRVYGVAGAADLASIRTYDGVFGHEKAGRPVTDPNALAAFYEASLALTPYGNDGFQAAEFGGEDEQTQTAHHQALADDEVTLRIETASGLVFFIRAYPEHGWLEGDLSYYRVSDEMAAWLAEYLS